MDTVLSPGEDRTIDVDNMDRKCCSVWTIHGKNGNWKKGNWKRQWKKWLPENWAIGKIGNEKWEGRKTGQHKINVLNNGNGKKGNRKKRQREKSLPENWAIKKFGNENWHGRKKGQHKVVWKNENVKDHGKNGNQKNGQPENSATKNDSVGKRATQSYIVSI